MKDPDKMSLVERNAHKIRVLILMAAILWAIVVGALVAIF